MAGGLGAYSRQHGPQGRGGGHCKAGGHLEQRDPRDRGTPGSEGHLGQRDILGRGTPGAEGSQGQGDTWGR